MLTDLAWARAARAAARAHARPAAALTASGDRLLEHHRRAAVAAPGRDPLRRARSAGNRPGRHGLWQRPLERRRLRQAPLLLPWSEGGLREAPAGGARRRSRARAARARSSPRGRRSRAGAGHRGDHLRRQPRQEGPRPRARRRGGSVRASGGVQRGGARRRRQELRGARRRSSSMAGASAASCVAPEFDLEAGEEGVRVVGRAARARSTARCCAARACSCAPRGARTTGSPSWRRSPTAACSSPPPRPAPTRRCRIARALDPRLVERGSGRRAARRARRPAARLRRRARCRRWRRSRREAIDRAGRRAGAPRLLG